MQKTFTVEQCLFDDILEDVFVYLSEKIEEKEIPAWRSYDIEKTENIYPLRRYYVSLYKGPIENPGRVVATAIIDVVDGENKAEVLVEWDKKNAEEPVFFYRKDNTIVVQYGWKTANDYSFSEDDYEVGTVCCQSTEQWLAMGYEQIDKQELINEMAARGFVDFDLE